MPNSMASVYSELQALETMSQRNFRLAVIVVACTLVGLRIFGLIFFGDFWLDDAMLAVNVRDVPFRDLLKPLPYFGQSSPVGFLFASKFMASIFGYGELSLRLLPTAALLLTWPTMLAACRIYFSRYVSLLASAMVCLSGLIAIYSFSFKHYTLELLCSSLLLLAFFWILKSQFRISAIIYLGALFCMAIPFSDSQPLLFAGFGSALFLEALAQRRFGWSGALGLSVVGVLCSLIWFSYYIFILRDSLYFQIFGNPEGYSGGIAPFSLTYSSFNWYSNYLFNIICLPFFPSAGYLNYTALAFSLFLFLLGCVTLFGRCRSLVIGYAITIGLMLALSRLQLFMGDTGKHFIFLAPYTAVILSVAGFSLLAMIARIGIPRWALSWFPFLVTMIVVVTYSGMTVVRIVLFPREQVRPLFAEIRSSGLTLPTWVFFAAQPAAEYYHDDLPQGYIGKVDHKSGVPDWAPKALARVGEDAESFGSVVRRCGAAWFVYAYHNDGMRQEKLKFLDAVNGDGGRCDLKRRSKGVGELYLCRAPSAVLLPSTSNVSNCTQ